MACEPHAARRVLIDDRRADNVRAFRVKLLPRRNTKELLLRNTGSLARASVVAQFSGSVTPFKHVGRNTRLSLCDPKFLRRSAMEGHGAM